MRILFCGINYAPDLIGIAKYTTELCEGLSAKGHQVRVVTAPPYYPEWKIPPRYRRWTYRSERYNGVFVRRAPIYVPHPPSGPKRLLHHASFAVASAVPVILEALRWRPHLFFSAAPSLMSSPMVAMAARLSGAVSWLHLQDFEVDAAFDLGLLHSRGLRRGAMVAAERRILRSFDRVSTIAPQMLRRLASKGVATERLREIRNWADTDAIVPGDRMTRLRGELGLGETDIVALYSGSMARKQGLELIIEAARRVGRNSPPVTFVLCGAGPERESLRVAAGGLDNIRFLGLQPNDRLAELLNTADIHLIPQRAEAADLVLPSKLGGMFASGRPVIAMATPATGLGDEVDGVGLLVAPGNAQALAAAVRRLAESRALRINLGARARQRALEHWNKGAIVSAVEREFLALCGEGHREPSRQGRLAGRPVDVNIAASQHLRGGSLGSVNLPLHRRTADDWPS